MGLVRALCRLLPLLTFLSYAAPAWAQGTTALFVHSDTGDPIGGGGADRTLLDGTDGTFSLTSASNRISVRVNSPTSQFTTLWSLEFSVAIGQTFPAVSAAGAPIEINNARIGPFSVFNGISANRGGSFCSRATGRYVIREAVFGPAGAVTAFAADFEEHCNDADAGIYGAIRFHSAIASLTPFGGAFPDYTVTIATPANGNVASLSGLTCGAGGSVCQQTFALPQSITLTATPDPGFIFAGWTDECSGGATTSLHLNAPKTCSARFEPEATGPRTLVFIDSLGADVVGGGRRQVYSPLNRNARISSISNSGSSLNISIDAVDPADTIAWSFSLSAASGDTIHVGSYDGALSSAGLRPGIFVRGITSCSSSGRFNIRELEFGSGGTVSRLAVDVEHHCSNSDTALFAAIRFNSTILDVAPFGGAYPTDTLTITPPAHGTISGDTLVCGIGGSACFKDFAGSPALVTLTPAAEPGYVFAGWTGDCFGTAPVAIRVNTVRRCGAAFEAISTATPRSLTYIDAQPGARFTASPAQTEVWSSLAARLTATSSDAGRKVQVNLTVLDPSGFTDFRSISFSAPAGQVLTAGSSYAPTWYYTAQATPGFDNDFSCSRFTGRFLVRDLSLASDGTVQRLAIDFEQHCDGRDAATFGSVRINSAVDARPFDGVYPKYRIAITRPGHGRVDGDGLSCAPSAGVCEVESPIIHQAVLTATPDAGFEFAGWAGACHGGTTIPVNVNGVKECGALFEPVPSGPRNRLTLNSQLGETILQGRAEVYSASNAEFSATIGSSMTDLSFTVLGRVDLEEEFWSIRFRNPTALQVGTYTNATSSFSSTGPFLSISGPTSCTVVGSRFTIRELAVASNFKVTRAAIDFEQHCNSAGSPALTGTIEYTAVDDAPHLAVDKQALSFASTVMPDNTIGNTTAAQTIRLSVTGGTIFWNVSATSSGSWLRVSPTFGAASANLVVSVVPGLAGLGTHTGTIAITAGSVTISIPVTWTLLGLETAPPFGLFESPKALTQNVSGAVALTGWALDDVEVTKVQIWRQPHPSDPPAAIQQGIGGDPNPKVFIGDATMIDGARPDVEAAFFSLPNRSRAGWGYMMLTRGLVWDGGGFFNLYAVAIDREGHSRTIGSTAISVNNALSLKPFGTIDTPGQGATASGLYPNTGWVLSASNVPIPAANVQVFIDGVPIPGVLSTAPRADISATFPSFNTSQAGRGLFIDTRTLAEGMHTIAWAASDANGQFDGIGSRFFRVANNGSGLHTAEQAASRPAANVSPDAVDATAPAMSAIRMRRGFDPSTPLETIQGSSDGFNVDFEELDRIEILLPASAGITYGGYLRALGEVRPLPAGAALNGVSGAFTWQPPAGFLGDYDIVFIATGKSGIATRHEVRVTIRPRTK